jgi:hypothetical protein
MRVLPPLRGRKSIEVLGASVWRCARCKHVGGVKVDHAAFKLPGGGPDPRKPAAA